MSAVNVLHAFAPRNFLSWLFLLLGGAVFVSPQLFQRNYRSPPASGPSAQRFALELFEPLWRWRRDNARAAGQLTFVPRIFGVSDTRPGPVFVCKTLDRTEPAAPLKYTVSTLKVSKKGRVPRDFDWRAYLDYHPGIQLFGARVTDEAGARAHYQLHGRAMQLIHKRLRVVVRYRVRGGLINQVYMSMAAMSLAVASGAEIELAPCVTRDSFNVSMEDAIWTYLPPSDILDVAKIVSSWQARGITVHKDSTLDKISHSSIIAKLPFDTNFARTDLDVLANATRDAVVEQVERVTRNQPQTEIKHIFLDLDYPFFMLRFFSAPQLSSEVFETLRFAPHLQSIAAKLVNQANGQFSSVHLRLEEDSMIHYAHRGGPDALLDLYIQGMQNTKFTADTAVFVASGLLSYGDLTAFNKVVNSMTAAGVCSRVIHKEQLMSKAELAELTLEQQAVIDLLVLAHGESFVGFVSSTFSQYIRFHRMLHHLRPETTTLVGGDDPFVSDGAIIV